MYENCKLWSGRGFHKMLFTGHINEDNEVFIYSPYSDEWGHMPEWLLDLLKITIYPGVNP